MNQGLGVLAGLLSSAFGGMAAGTTRFVIGNSDPITIGAFRFGIGFLILLPLALLLRQPWPRGKDWFGVTGLGLLFFGLFPIIFNAAFIYTTAARGSLALSTLPLLTMAVGALLGIERLGVRKTAGVLIATGGVALALAAGLSTAPEGAWRGDLLMVAAALCMAFYNVWSRPFIARSAPLSFAAASMGIGSSCLALLGWWRGGFDAVNAFGKAQWIAVGYLGLFGGAVAFFLWVFALERASPTRVASTITINPIAASLVAAALMGEEIRLNLLAGVAAVLIGIWIAASEPAKLSG
jgi:drug/metabolite transporter (DMT)-like permease